MSGNGCNPGLVNNTTNVTADLQFQLWRPWRSPAAFKAAPRVDPFVSISLIIVAGPQRDTPPSSEARRGPDESCLQICPCIKGSRSGTCFFLWPGWEPGFESMFWSDFSVGRELRGTDGPWGLKKTIEKTNYLQYRKTGVPLPRSHMQTFAKSTEAEDRADGP